MRQRSINYLRGVVFTQAVQLRINKLSILSTYTFTNHNHMMLECLNLSNVFSENCGFIILQKCARDL